MVESVYLPNLRRGYGVAWHGNGQSKTLTDGSRKDLAQFVGCSLCFWGPTLQAVLKLIQGLAHWIGEGHIGVVHKGHVADTPP